MKNCGLKKEFVIILLTNEFPPVAGGVATYCYELVRALNDLNVTVTVVAAEKGLNVLDFDKIQPFAIHRVKEYSFSFIRHIARLFVLLRWTKNINPMYYGRRIGVVVL